MIWPCVWKVGDWMCIFIIRQDFNCKNSNFGFSIVSILHIECIFNANLAYLSWKSNLGFERQRDLTLLYILVKAWFWALNCSIYFQSAGLFLLDYLPLNLVEYLNWSIAWSILVDLHRKLNLFSRRCSISYFERFFESITIF